MLAHRLRHRVTFQEKAPAVRDEDGNFVSGGWRVVDLYGSMLLDNVPAEVLTGPGREFQGAASTQSEATARINLRWFYASERDMATWRVLWDGRIYNVQSVETDATGRREWRLRGVDGPSEGM